MGFTELRLESLAALIRVEANEILKEGWRCAAAADQFDRAVESLKCNVYEARGQVTTGKKIYHYGLARGSADEARGCVGSFTAAKAISDKTAFKMVGLLIAAAKMITSLCDVIETDAQVQSARSEGASARSEAPTR